MLGITQHDQKNYFELKERINSYSQKHFDKTKIMINAAKIIISKKSLFLHFLYENPMDSQTHSSLFV